MGYLDRVLILKKKFLLVDKSKYILFAILAGVFLICFLHINNLLNTGGDNAHYIILAKSLLQGKGYRDIFLADSPIHTQYPPLFPILLLPVVALFGIEVTLLKFVPLLCGLGAIFVLYHLILEFTNRKTALIITLITSFSSVFIRFSTLILSEIPYLLFSFSSLFFITRFANEDKKTFTKNGFWGAIFLVASFFTRSIGISLVVAVALYFFLERRKNKKGFVRKLMLLGIPPLLAIVYWLCRSLLFSESGYMNSLFLVDPYNIDSGYIGYYYTLVRIIKTLRSYLFALSGFFIPFQNPISLGIGGFISLIAFLGFIVQTFRKRTIIEYYFIAYFVILLIWPWSYPRFLLPIFPFILLYFFKGLSAVFERLSYLSKKEHDLKTIDKVLLGILVASLLILMTNKSVDASILGRWSIKYFSVLLSYAIFVGLTLIIFLIPSFRKWVCSLLAQNKNLIIFSIIALLIISNLAIKLTPPYGVNYDENWKEYYKAAKFIKKNTPEDAILMARKHRIMYIWTQRKMAQLYPFTENRDQVINSIIEQKVDHIIVGKDMPGKTEEKYLLPAIQREKRLFKEIYSANGMARIFKVKDRENK